MIKKAFFSLSFLHIFMVVNFYSFSEVSTSDRVQWQNNTRICYKKNCFNYFLNISKLLQVLSIFMVNFYSFSEVSTSDMVQWQHNTRIWYKKDHSEKEMSKLPTNIRKPLVHTLVESLVQMTCSHFTNFLKFAIKNAYLSRIT